MSLIGLGTIYVGTIMVNSISSMVNGKFTRDQQKKLAEQNQKFNAEMEENRQNFQLRINQENAKHQREMSENNHRLRLLEQENQFKLMCQGDEWKHFLNNWPLHNLPSVLRQDQLLDDGTVALRVFFTKNDNKFFSGYIYPFVEQGLVEFVDCYHNVFHSRNITFYHNAYKSNIYGGSFNKNIQHALREMPVIIIDTNVLLDEICVSATIWGFDNTDGHHDTLFKLPYKVKSVDGKVDIEYTKDLSNQILAHLKFVLGYVYDTYNLVMYNKAPLLPKISQYEFEHGVKSAPLGYEDIVGVFGKQYSMIYSLLLGTGDSKENAGFAEKPESFKKTILHELRLEYALAIKDIVSFEAYVIYLDESIRSWCEIRTTLSVTEFINSFSGDEKKILQYFSAEDIDYFKRLCYAYKNAKVLGRFGKVCLSVEDDIVATEFKAKSAKKSNLSAIESPTVKFSSASEKKKWDKIEL